MPHAVRIHEHGGPEVLRYEPVELGPPGRGEVQLQQTAIGLNFIDTYHRNGLYPVPEIPTAIGMEAAGRVEVVGEDVQGFRSGDRVAYATGPPGAYASERNMPADRLVKLPDGITEKEAAGILLKGMTVEYLIRRTFRVEPGMPVLFHAAAGGVGLIACQWLKAMGATVIGTVGTAEKAETARAHGCDHPIRYDTEDYVERVNEITNGEGVPVVYDGVGAATWEGSLECLRPRGTMVSFGNASGEPPAFKPIVLSQKGSLYLTRPKLFDYTDKRDELLASANALFEVVQNGQVKVEVNQTYPLEEAAKAHRDLEARKTTGATILVPGE